MKRWFGRILCSLFAVFSVAGVSSAQEAGQLSGQLLVNPQSLGPLSTCEKAFAEFQLRCFEYFDEFLCRKALSSFTLACAINDPSFVQDSAFNLYQLVCISEIGQIASDRFCLDLATGIVQLNSVARNKKLLNLIK